MTVADRIKQKRIELNLSQEELAKRGGYADKSAISKLEHAGNEITLKQIKRIAPILGVTPENLMGWEMVQNETESSILKRYRLSDDLTKSMILRILDIKE